MTITAWILGLAGLVISGMGGLSIYLLKKNFDRQEIMLDKLDKKINDKVCIDGCDKQHQGLNEYNERQKDLMDKLFESSTKTESSVAEIRGFLFQGGRY